MRWIGFLRRTARFECLLYIATEGNQSRPRDKLRLRRKFGVWGALSDAQFKATQDPPLLEPDAQGWGTLHTFLVLGARVPGQNQGLVSRPDNPDPDANSAPGPSFRRSTQRDPRPTLARTSCARWHPPYFFSFECPGTRRGAQRFLEGCRRQAIHHFA